MRVAFICGSLEIGRDGVGDYTRRIAGELIRRGHAVKIIALHEKQLLNVKKEVQFNGPTEVRVLRLPSTLRISEQRRLSKLFLEDLNPEWISLQFVNFSFHRKGLPWHLTNTLSYISNDCKWHLMLHELWVGVDNSRFSLLGFLQEKLLRKIVDQLKPSIVHTHLPLYYNTIKGFYAQVKQLPLFSNIFSNNTVRLSHRSHFKICLFSQVEISTKMLLFLTEIADEIRNNNKSLKVVLIGGNEKKLSETAAAISALEGFEDVVDCHGFLNEEQVSNVLIDCDLAMTPLPLHAIGKSGTVAAFISHGLPVVVLNVSHGYESLTFSFFNAELAATLIFRPNMEEIKGSKSKLLNAHRLISLEMVTDQFISDLQSYKNTAKVNTLNEQY